MPIEVTESGITTDFNFVLLNAESSIEVTEFPIITDSKKRHVLKAELPIEVTESGITTDFNFVSKKAAKPIDLTEFPIVTDSKKV